MAKEIERKFLVDTNAWAPTGPGVRLTQGYLSSNKDRVVRVRIEGDKATLTVKGATRGISRAEFEYAIPLTDASEMLASLCEQPLIDKHRHVETHGGRRWEIDVFHGANDGLVLAEVELPSEDAVLALPPWARADVSSDPRYFNSNLLAHPYSEWWRR
jgi:CYTH domain-containing protein